jgi:hypothetical protein
MTGLFKKLYSIAHGQWLHCNATLHEPDKRHQQQALQELKNQIMEEHIRGPADLPTRDRSHFRTPLLTLLNEKQAYLQSWLMNVTAARNFQARKMTHNNDLIASSHNRSAVLQWAISKKLDMLQDPN